MIKNKLYWDLPGVQWLRIHLPMQETWVLSPLQENPTYLVATKPMHHNYDTQIATTEPVYSNKDSAQPKINKINQ